MEKLPSVYFDNQIQKNWADQVTEMKKFRTTQHPELFYILTGDTNIFCFGSGDYPHLQKCHSEGAKRPKNPLQAVDSSLPFVAQSDIKWLVGNHQFGLLDEE